MTLEIVFNVIGAVSIFSTIFEFYLLHESWKERDRIKDKEEEWNEHVKAIVFLTSKWQKDIEKNLVQN